MKTKKITTVITSLTALLFLFFGCGAKEKTGTLKINLTDTPGTYEEVFITFSEVSVHRGEDQDNSTGNAADNAANSGWIIIEDEEQGFDLLTLQSGNFTLLAEAKLAAGIYTQIRLKISDGEDENGEPKTYVKVGGEKYALKVPSGTKSGLKFTHPFRIEADNETVFFVDFDAEKSVKQTGKGNYQLKPTISILSELSPNHGEQGITGTVQDSTDNESIEGATVFAYLETDNATEPNASAKTDEEGYFILPVAEGTYTLEVDAAGYETYTMDSMVVGTGFKELGPIKLDLL